ncbi:MAG: carboxy-S-adenosyl-L-methionine synthase CmoA [Gammaproteobacteria bacterium]|uniref:Carboxy-S-adenosyl-L-methionine synthase n=1 Tax=Marinobacter nitratireducens TaxID=1137280 RepID=A0A072N2V5_9GAMM|nr:carboxy-S-adenosyl-L-methionine synthase CmoA [Marinobacter nitratireducens]KEF31542.1 tRNA (uridine-5-oxyacetic acid methyl ester) 34 synthase [Marinobacter nitratireducens]TNE71560.1 MAG: carboxy-S-adenosyl-L-methionine synthase CmoA [Gammaproteobacteria bacterium]
MTDAKQSPKQPKQLTDRLFATERKPEDFRFDASVARVFPDMIRRSVPGYTTVIPMIEVITEQYVQPGTNCYDLGCSLGAATLAMRHGIHHDDCQLIGVDNSGAMIERCRHYVALDDHPLPVTLRCEDILDTELSDASVTTLNYTLQFVPPEKRESLLRRIADATRPGGALILSEKVRFESEQEQEIQTRLHHEFKRANGYSDLEISQKRAAIEQVLIPETLDTHKQRLLTAGFSEVFLWYQCFNFVSILAIKPK